MTLKALLVAAVKAEELIRFFLSVKNSTLFFLSCKLLGMEGEHEETDTWITLKAAILNVVTWLHLNKHQAGHSNERACQQQNDDKNDEERLRYIEHRIRDLREFERRVRGKR